MICCIVMVNEVEWKIDSPIGTRKESIILFNPMQLSECDHEDKVTKDHNFEMADKKRIKNVILYQMAI